MNQNKLQFIGKGGELLGLLLTNWLLNIVTIGFYYPWARVKMIKFYWRNTLINDTPFEFTGTGNEIFKAYIKLLVVAIIFYASYLYAAFTENSNLMVAIGLFSSLLILCIIPLAVHGALRYRTARTTWRGIHMGYRGERGQLYTDFVVGYLLTILTFGIYSSWFISRLRTYIIENLRFGNLKFEYTGNGFDLLIIQIKGTVLSFLTLGIYWFWYRKEWMEYFANNVIVKQGDNRYPLDGNYSGSSIFGLYFTNFLILIFTLGIGTPWVIVRTYQYLIENLDIPAEIDFDKINQTEDEYQDATGEYIADIFDLGIV
jgi:uncharacterized membrane protein YjgN (DUF898 family)